MPLSAAALRKRLRQVRALVTDVDGVLTDGGMYYGTDGEVLKKFNTRDGMGLRLVQEAGIKVAFLTAEEGGIARARARKLRVPHVLTGARDKLKMLEGYIDAQGLSLEETIYIGDDLNDLPALKAAGVAVAPADAARPVLGIVHWVTACRAGEGVVREVCDAILACRGTRLRE